MSDSRKNRVSPPPPISVEEFDRRAEAGEDLDEYFDWDNGVMLMPGELSPGQRLSMQLEAEEERHADESASTRNRQFNLNIPLPEIAVKRLRRLAKLRGLSQEDLAQLLIVQQLDQQEALS